MKLQAVSALVNSAVLLIPQVFGLFSLDAAGYGRFSLVYLVYALGTSLALSIVLEAWSRTKVHGDTVGVWRGYSSTLQLIAVLSAVISAAVALVVGASAGEAAIATAAVLLAIYRFGARYYEVQAGHLRRSLIADGSALAGMFVAIIGSIALDAGLSGVLGSWALGQLLGLLVGLKPSVPSSRATKMWFSEQSSSIRPLLKDSLLMDASAIGTPYILAGTLGVAGIGIYRAVSSAAAPVRLVLTAVRPILARATPTALRRPKVMASVLGITSISAIAVYGALMLIGTNPRFGVVGQLEPYALPTALFVGANFLGQFFAISMRINAPSRRTLQARILQSSLALVMPLVGVWGWGLSGAIWGYSLATTVASMNWMVQALRRT